MAGEFDDLIPSSAASTGEFDDLVPQKKEPVGQLEGLVNALRRGVSTAASIPSIIDLASTGETFQGRLAKERSKWGMPQDPILAERQAIAADKVIKNLKETDDIPRSEAQERMSTAKSWQDKFKIWARDPVELTATIALESLPPSVVGAVSGGLLGGAPGMVAGVGLSSGISTFAGEFLGNAAARGVDLRDPDAIQRWLNSRAFDDDFSSAAAKSSVIGAIDSATAGAAGTFIRPALRSGLKNVAIASAKELGMQAAGGAGGEALGSAAGGKPIDPFDVFAEAIAEVASGPGEVVGNLRGELGAQRVTRANTEREELRNRVQQILETRRTAPPVQEAQTPETPPPPQDELTGAIEEVRSRITRRQDERRQEQEDLEWAVGEVRQRLTRTQEAPPAAPTPVTPAPQPKEPDAVQEQKAAQLPVGEQAQVGPQVEQEIRQEAPPEVAAQALPSGAFGSVDINQPKVPIELLFDPGQVVKGGNRKAKRREAGPIEGVVTIGKTGKNSGWLLIQYRTSAGADPRTVWRAKVSDLQNAGIMTGTTVDLDKLYASPLLQKLDDQHFLAVKLPTERAERAEGATVDAVIEQAGKINTFYAALLKELQNIGWLTSERSRALAGAKTGGAQYAGKGASEQAGQVHRFLKQELATRLEQLRGTNSEEFRTLQAINQRLQAESPTFTPEDVTQAAIRISSDEEISQIVQDKAQDAIERVEVPLEGGTRGESTSGDEGKDKGLENVLGQWDPQQMETVIGKIEDIDPKLYASFNAEPEDDGAWNRISAGLKKLFDAKQLGTPQNAEELADLIREMRSNNQMFNPGTVSVAAPTYQHRVAIGHEGLLELFSDRSIPMNEEMRELALALINGLPAKYFKDLAVELGVDGGIQGEFVNAIDLARVAANAHDPMVAVHEMSHYLAKFLTGKEREAVSRMRRAEISKLKNSDPENPFFKWLEDSGGSAKSAEYVRWKGSEVPEDVIAAYGSDFVWGRDFPPNGDTRVERLRRQHLEIAREVNGLPVVRRAEEQYDTYLAELADKFGEDGGGRWWNRLEFWSAASEPQIRENLREAMGETVSDKELEQLDKLRRSWLSAREAEMQKRGAGDIDKAFDKLTRQLEKDGMASVSDPLYYLINDDEFFAHQFSMASSRSKPDEMQGILDRVKQFVIDVLTALKALSGNSEAYFDRLIKRFKRGRFSVDARGGVLFEGNQNPRMMGLVSKPKQAERYEEVERGQDEETTVNGLIIEQNEPMVSHVRPLFDAMPKGVKNQLNFIRDRLLVLQKAMAKGRVASNSPLRTYATIQNGLQLEEQANSLSRSIDKLVDKLSQKQGNLPKVTEKQAEAKALKDTVSGIIRDFKDDQLNKARADEAAGRATALEQTIKYLDQIQGSSVALERAVQHMAERMSVEELTTLDTKEIIEAFKSKLSQDNGGRPWEEATIPAGENQPGVSNEQLRVAIKLIQTRLNLAEDLLDIKELHDPGLRQIIDVNEADWDAELKKLTRNKLKNFLNEVYRGRTAEDKAKAIYLKHHRQVRAILKTLQDKLAAYDFVHDHILMSPQFKMAMQAAKDAGFMDDTLYVDETNNKVHRRIYRNPNPPAYDKDGKPKIERAIIEYGFSRDGEKKNVEEFRKVVDWLEQYLETGTDPMVKARAEFELRRIMDYELNSAWSPEAGKLAPSPYNPLMWFANLWGGSSQFVLNRIGGRAAMQTAHMHTLYDDIKRDATEKRHHLRWPKTKAVIAAAKAHGVTVQEWRDEVADPLLVSHNSLGAKAVKVGEELWTGRKVKPEDMAALKAQKVFVDGVAGAAFRVKTKLGEFFPVKTFEKMFGREFYRPQQSMGPLMMPRRLSGAMYEAIRTWSGAKRGRGSKEAAPDLRALVESGPLFEQLVISHLRSINLYPDYVGGSKFKKQYHEIWRKIKDEEGPNTFTELVDMVFDGQAGQETAEQMSKEDIANEILLGEIDPMIKRVQDDPIYEHDTLGGGTTVDVLSGNNFLSRARGRMIAPDSGYHYSIIDNADENWVMKSVLEVQIQKFRDGLQMVKDGLEAELAKFKNLATRAKAKQDQLDGNQWLDYGEAKSLLKQVNTLLDRSNPTAFGLFIDQYNRGIFRHLWSLVQQSLLGAFPVMWRNFMGGTMRMAHADALINNNGALLGIPKWMLRLPITLGRGVAMPFVDTAGLLKKSFDHKKVVKALGEDVVKAIQENPDLINQYSGLVAVEAMRNAADYQDALDLDVVGSYGLRNQIEQYAELYASGGELRTEPQSIGDKVRGGIISTIGLMQETGFPTGIPRAFAPRKIEQIINFAAMMRAKRVKDQLQLNILKAIRNREELGHEAKNLSAAELLGDPKAKESWAAYLRNLFNRAGINLDYAAARFEKESKTNPNAQLLTDSERRSFYLAFMKEVNMAGSENRIRFKGEAAQVLSSLMGYGFYQNEAFANAMARFSREKPSAVKAMNKALMIGAITTLIAVGFSQPWQRLMRALLYNEEDPAGRFATDNTKMRNAQIFWEQTAPFWPITGSIINQLYDVRAGGNKFFNFLPMSVMTSFIQAGNEMATTGDVAYPLARLIRQWVPNSKMILNRVSGMEGLTDVNNAARIFREVNDGSVEVRPVSNQPVRPSPISTEIRTAVNELVKDNPDWSVISAVREMAIDSLAGRGIARGDAEKRFDSGVLARTPQNTVYGKVLTVEERATQLARMNPTQRAAVEGVESSFNTYAARYGLKPRALTSAPKVMDTGPTTRTARAVSGRLTRSGGRALTRGTLRRPTLRRPKRNTRNRSNRLTRGY